MLRKNGCDATHRKPFGLGLTYVNEVHKHAFYTWKYNHFILLMVIQYTMDDVELPHTVKVTCLINIQEFIIDLVLNLIHPV